MKKKLNETFESYDSDGLEIAITEFAAGVATFIQRSEVAIDADLVLESVADDIRLQVLSFLEDEEDFYDEDPEGNGYDESTQYDNVINESNHFV